MGAEDDPFLRPAGKLGHHIPGGGDGLRLLHGDADLFRRGAHQGEGVLGVDIHAGNLPAFGHVGTEGLLVDIPVREMHVSVIGDEPHGAGIQQILIHPVGDPRIQQDDFPLGPGQGRGIGVGQVAQGRLHAAAGAQLIPFAGNRPAVRRQGSGVNLRRIHVKGLHIRPGSQLFTKAPQVFGGLFLLRGPAGAHIIRLFQNLPNGLFIHRFPASIAGLFFTQIT